MLFDLENESLKQEENEAMNEEIVTTSPFEYEGNEMPECEEEIIREFEADDKHLHDVLAFLEEELEKHEAGLKQTMAMTLSLEEAFVNVAHYAYEGQEEGTGKVWIRLAFDGDNVDITLLDDGMAFDPLAKEDPDIKSEVHHRKIGGLGIYMIKKSMDSVRYKRNGRWNILTMGKKFR
ncbi:MAG: ATP-binding protein [Erysipelotrichaceae bacterium]|nr:ATP-binding protein [Erysipelotrichaceae bacterium]